MVISLLARAWAAGVDADVELVHPTFAPGALPGVDSPDPTEPGAVHVGGGAMFLLDPVVLYDQGVEQGSVVHQRVSGRIGAELGAGTAAGLRVGLPAYAQWGSETEEYARDGAAVGDLSLGARLSAWKLGPVQTGARVDLHTPTSTPEAWAGERAMRVQPGVLAALEQGDFRVGLDLSAVLRPTVSTRANLAIGPELNLGSAVACTLRDGQIQPFLGVVGHLPLNPALVDEGSGGFEALGGAGVRPVDDLRLDVVLGHGLADGYGTTRLRAGLLVTWSRVPEREPEPVLVDASPPPRPTPELVDFAEPEDADDEVDLKASTPAIEPAARIVAERIVIRDPIQFERGTDRIAAPSYPTLDAVARIMNEHPEILHVVIEGHASDEGSYTYNYDLSVRRSLAVYRALVEAGVHPARLSYRGAGEVAPAARGEDEAALAQNRRVVFQILQRWVPGEPFPGWSDTVRVPWSGETVRVVPPPPGFGQSAPPPPSDPLDPPSPEEEDR